MLAIYLFTSKARPFNRITSIVLSHSDIPYSQWINLKCPIHDGCRNCAECPSRREQYSYLCLEPASKGPNLSPNTEQLLKGNMVLLKLGQEHLCLRQLLLSGFSSLVNSYVPRA